MKAGDTFYNRNPKSPLHLWVVATDPDEAGAVVIFKVRRRQHSPDHECVIPLGHHECARDCDMAIDYDSGKLFPLDGQEEMRKRGWHDARESLRPAIVLQVREGAVRSLFTPRPLKKRIGAMLDSRRPDPN